MKLPFAINIISLHTIEMLKRLFFFIPMGTHFDLRCTNPHTLGHNNLTHFVVLVVCKLGWS